ncbi:MAG: adenylate/guanylate cyclase domain-containing protein [Gammaproteobacteria bacterium]|nr:adenylate/guanylate cyclase domain-containing protein [Gammaproteobacteria bacterium]
MSIQAERRLAAIFSADAVGFTRLMAENDLQTLQSIKEHRETIAGQVRQYGGRVVDAVGDNLLAEFASAVDAVDCAIEVQDQLTATNAQQPETQRMDFRIGINVGELVADEERIAGDGVNIAARVQSLAPPGGIAITGTVLDHVEGRINVDVDDQGPQELKNVPRPVRVLFVNRAGEKSAPKAESTAVPGFEGRHAIAVLPFRNLSQDVEQEYFADGLSEDLINRLSALRLYPVIARNSSFAYRGDDRDVREMGRLLGAHYIVSGSVRRSGNKVRVSVELVDSHDAHQLWSERYDRELSDIFKIQDEITDSVAGSLSPVLSHSELRHAMQLKPQDLDAWDCIHRGTWHLTQGSRDDNIEAKKWAQRALELQPEASTGYTLLAFSHQYDIIYQWSASQEESIRLAIQTAEKAVSLDKDDHMALTALGYACNLAGDQARAITVLERAIELNPSSALGHWALGSALMLAQRPDEGIPLIEKAMRLSPSDPITHEFLFSLGAAHFLAGRYEQAAQFARDSLKERAGQAGAYRLLGASLGSLSPNAEAREAVEKMMQLVPGMSEAHLKSFLPAAVAERYVEGLRKAGWDG